MEREELRQDWYTVSLLTDHTVLSSKYRGQILVGDVVFTLEGINSNLIQFYYQS